MTGKENPPLPQSESTNYPTQPPEEVMGFVDFIRVLIRKKNLVFLITAISILLSVGYSLWVTPVYKVRIGFLPPQKIILPKSLPVGATKETKTSLYKKFLGQLQSFNHRKKVFESGNFIEKFKDTNQRPTKPEELLLTLNSSITLRQNIYGEKHFPLETPVYLDMLGSKPEAMVEFLNSLSKVAIKNIQTEVITEVTNNLIEKNKIIEKRKLKNIESLKRRIDNLKKELGIARNLKVVENNFSHARSGARQPKWFLYGEKALKEEINRLQLEINEITLQETSVDLKSAIDVNRDSQTFNGSKPAQSEYEKFDTSNLSQIKIQVASISQPSIVPSAPLEPRKPLIISIGVLMGLFLGVILAFISDTMEYLGRRKESSR
jgi:LPS O-antigen subunit length determinant protein (WzzB/FepE family)